MVPITTFVWSLLFEIMVSYLVNLCCIRIEHPPPYLGLDLRRSIIHLGLAAHPLPVFGVKLAMLPLLIPRMPVHACMCAQVGETVRMLRTYIYIPANVVPTTGIV